MLATQAGIKEVVDRPRPSEVAAGIEVRASQISPSFPAGHVMGAVVVYGWTLAMLLQARKRVRFRAWNPAVSIDGLLEWWYRARIALMAMLGAVVLLTGVVNIWLGVHWPTDVLGGYLWGAVLLMPALVAYE